MGRARWGWALVVAWLCGAGTVRGEPLPTLRVGVVDPLRVGAHAVLPVELALGPAGARPVMLTVAADGEAVEVVRGRLLRGDARDGEAAVLYFEVPLLARGEGQTVVHLRADGYRCDPRCTPVHLSESVVLEVRR